MAKPRKKKPQPKKSLKAIQKSLLSFKKLDELIDSRQLEKARKGLKAYIDAGIREPQVYFKQGYLELMADKPFEAIAFFKKSLKNDPGNVWAYFNMAASWMTLKQYEEAERDYLKCIELEPRLSGPYIELAKLQDQIGKTNQALDNCHRALQLSPTDGNVIFDFLRLSGKACLWDNFDQNVEYIRQYISSYQTVDFIVKDQVSPYILLNFLDDPEVQRLATRNKTRLYVRDLPNKEVRFTEPGKLKIETKVRLGYLSPDFRNHAISRMFTYLLQHHNRDRFEVIGFYCGPAGRDNDVVSSDDFDEWYEVRGLGPHTAKVIHDKKIDILVDLAGHTKYTGFFYLHYRPAPIQAHYMGYPGTLGSDFVDYVISITDQMSESALANFDEKVVGLPTVMLREDNRKEVLAIQSEGEAFEKEPEIGDKFVFACVNDTRKFTASIVNAWIKILTTCENSVIVFHTKEKTVSENLLKHFAEGGIEASRVIVRDRLEYEDYLRSLLTLDLVLDTFPYHSASVALDLLSCGVPIVTLEGETWPARTCSSFLRTLGVESLITQDIEGYIAKAVSLYQDPEALAGYTDTLNNSDGFTRMFDPEQHVKYLEQAYETMIEQAQSDQGFQNFDVPEQ